MNSSLVKKIAWTAGIALAVVIVWPIVKPYAQKLPFVGAWIS
jgi:hypothetical protein